MTKYWNALILPLFLLTSFSIFSTESLTARQYQLDADTEIVATTDANNEPVVPGEGRTETSPEKA